MNLRKNMWVADPDSKLMVYVIDFKLPNIGSYKIEGYGFGVSGKWAENEGGFSWGFWENYYEPTVEEVQRRLLEEVKKRGYVNGKQYLYVGEIYNKSSYPFLHLYKLKYYLTFNILTDGHGSVIFQNGKWASIEQLPPLKGSYFPNGFASWYETHHEMVTMINHALNSDNTFLLAQQCDGGTGRMYELAKEWTDEFEEKYKGHCWDGEFIDAIEAFVIEKIKPQLELCIGNRIRITYLNKDFREVTITAALEDNRINGVITKQDMSYPVWEVGELMECYQLKSKYNIKNI